MQVFASPARGLSRVHISPAISLATENSENTEIFGDSSPISMFSLFSVATRSTGPAPKHKV